MRIATRQRRPRQRRSSRGAPSCWTTLWYTGFNFIALGCEPGERDVYKTWIDPPPNVVFEVSSKSTRRKDKEVKPETYMRVGVREIILYDPRGEAQPALVGLRIVDGAIVPIEPDASGAIESEELGVLLRLSGNSLVVVDRRSGEILHTDCEAYSAELAKMTAEAAAMKEENRKLRDALKAHGIDPDV